MPQLPSNANASGLVTAVTRFVIFLKTDGLTDTTWTTTHLGPTSIAEAGTYVIAVCLPTYRSLYRSISSRPTQNVDPTARRVSKRKRWTDIELQSLSKTRTVMGISEEQLVSMNTESETKEQQDTRITTLLQ